jgi:hypothetical protein
MIELGPWTLETGLNIGEFLTAIAELRKALSTGTFDRQVAASKAGIILESLLDFLTLKYRCSVPRNPSGEHTLGELAQGIDSKLAKALVSRKPQQKGPLKRRRHSKPLLMPPLNKDGYVIQSDAISIHSGLTFPPKTRPLA